MGAGGPSVGDHFLSPMGVDWVKSVIARTITNYNVVWIYLVLVSILMPLPPLVCWLFVILFALCKWEMVFTEVHWDRPYRGYCCLQEQSTSGLFSLVFSRITSPQVSVPLLVALLCTVVTWTLKRKSFVVKLLREQAAAVRIEQLGAEKQRLDFERRINESMLRRHQMAVADRGDESAYDEKSHPP